MLNINFSFGGVLIFGQQVLHVVGDGRLRGKENGDAQFAFENAEHPFRLVRKGVFLVPGKIPAAVMFKPEIVHHGCEKEQQHDLENDVGPNLEPVNRFRFVRHRYSLHLRD